MQTVFLSLKTTYSRGGRIVTALLFLGISTALTPIQRCFGSQQIYAKVAGKSAMPTTPENSLMEKDRRILEQLLAEAQRQPTLASRMKFISARLLGQPYILHPLIGSVSEPEQFVVRMDGFDCVTFIETVLAASTATTVDEFVKRLRHLRYANGEVSYLTRMHYTTDWHAAQVRKGFFQDLTQGPHIAERSKVLNGVPGLPPRQVNVRYFPKSKLTEVSPTFQDGDLIYFVAGRRWLDTNHVGLLFRQDGQLRVRHASHRLGGVVEQSLADYFAANEMIGFMVARPVESR